MIPLSRPLVGPEELTAVERVLKSGHLTAGPEVEKFEQRFAEYVGAKEAIAVANGTLALELCLRTLNLSPGDEVIVPSFTFMATASAVVLAGGTPIFADIDPRSYCLAPATVLPHITPRTVAIVVVHLYGQPADLAGLKALSEQSGLSLIEDCAQAIGSRYQGAHVGSFGLFGTFSFYPTKNLTTGEGGMITTNDPGFGERVRLLRNQGSQVRYHHEIIGTNARMSDISAAIGSAQLERLEERNEQRRRNAAYLSAELSSDVIVPRPTPETVHSYHQYTVRTGNRNHLMRELDAAGVGYGIYYETPCHLQPPFMGATDPLPETELAATEVLSLPIRPDLSQHELEHVALSTKESLTHA